MYQHNGHLNVSSYLMHFINVGYLVGRFTTSYNGNILCRTMVKFYVAFPHEFSRKFGS